MKTSTKSAVLAIVASTALTASVLAQSIETATIDVSDGVLTMVNVLTPELGRQEDAIRLLQAGMTEEMSAQPGFISSSIHRSLNSDHVVVYAQWEDQASVDAAVEVIQGGGAPNMAEVFAIASPDFHPYSVESVHPSQDR